MARTQSKLHISLTEAGKVMLRGIGFVAFAALVIPAFGVLSILVCVVLVAVVVGFFLRPRVHVSGDLPDRVVAGQPARLTYTLRNIGRLPAYSISARFHTLPESIEQTAESGAICRLAPGETADVAIAIQPQRRGRHRIHQPACESSFPFNLIRFGASQETQETLTVLPAFSRVQIPLRYVSRHVNTSNVRPAGRTGASPEYIGSRPFMTGDSPRRIDARAWARLAVPATKEYDDDMDDYAAFILDTRVTESWLRLSKPTEVKELEAAVSLCASIAYTIQGDCLFDLLLAGSELHEFSAWPKAVRLHRMHEILAGVEPSKGYSLEEIGPLLEDRLAEISEIVFILLRWDETYRRLVDWAQRAGCHATVIVIGEDKSVARPSSLIARAAGPDASNEERATSDSSTETEGLGVDGGTEVRFVSADDVLAGRVEYL